MDFCSSMVQLVPWTRYRCLGFLQWWEQSVSIYCHGSLFYEYESLTLKPRDEEWIKST